MSLVGLRVFAEVARRGSFTATAVALGYTQSAVSRQIATLEAVAAVPLFDRGARGVKPTAAGEVLLRHATRILGDVEAAEQELAGLKDRLAGRLPVGSYPLAAAAFVPRAIARLRQDHPALDVRLAESSSPAQVRRLRAGRIEVAIIAVGSDLPPYDLSGLRTEVVSAGRGLGIAVGADHPFASRPIVDVDELADEAWVVGTGSAHAPQFGAWPTLVEPRVRYEATNWSTRLGIVASGLAISVLPGLAAEIVPQGVAWIRVHDPGLVLGRETLVVTAAERSHAAAAMVRALREEASASRAASQSDVTGER
jgi:DNA-binding transcriptional LysR family regulator